MGTECEFMWSLFPRKYRKLFVKLYQGVHGSLCIERFRHSNFFPAELYGDFQKAEPCHTTTCEEGYRPANIRSTLENELLFKDSATLITM